MGALILCYHHIDYGERIDPNNFESNLLTLKKEGFRPITLKEIYEYISSGRNPPKKSVHITFDDGYADNFIYAYPLLKKYGYYATIFVIANKVANNIKRATYEELVSMNIAHKVKELIDKSRYVSWEELGEMVSSGIFEVGSHSSNHTACFSSKKIEKFNDTGTIEWLYELTKDRRLGIPVFEKKWDCATKCIEDDVKLRDYLADFVSKKGGVLFFKNKKSAMNTLFKECRKYLKRNSVEFKYENDERQKERIKMEIYDSKTIIEKNVNAKVDFFCYPWGDYDSVAIEEVKKAQYKGALTLDVGVNTKNTDLYLLKRAEVRGGKWLSKRLNIYKNDFISSLYSRVYRRI